MSNNSEIRRMSRGLKKIPKLSKKKEAYLIRNLKSKNKLRREAAIQKLWRAKLYLIINVVWKVRNIGAVPELSEGDLLSEASIGLLSGIKSKTLNNDDNIDAYLKKSILNCLRAFIKSQSRIIAIKGGWRKIKAVLKAQKELSQKNMKVPSKREIAESSGLKQSEVEEAYSWMEGKKISLDSQIRDEDSLSWHELISAGEDDNQEERLESHILHKALKKAILKLSPKVGPHILAYYGLEGGGEKTFKEIAIELGQSKQSIDKAVKKGLAKLCKNPNLRKIYEESIKRP